MNRAEILKELEETRKDLFAFKAAKDSVQHRINDMEGTPRQDSFVGWAVTQVILNGLVLGIVRCEGLIEDYRKILEELEVPNNVVQLVERNKE